MQEHHHTRTTPGEPIAPEIVPHAVHVEPGGHAQAEDINIPLLAVCVAGFAVGLAVTIIGLQAWFYNADAAERDAKWRPDPTLNAAVQQAQQELTAPAGINTHIPNARAANIRHIPIDNAIDATVQEYASREKGTPNRK